MIATPEIMTRSWDPYYNELSSLEASINLDGWDDGEKWGVDKENKNWLNGILKSVKSELENAWEANSDLRTSRDIKLENIRDNSFEVSSYWCKMLLENNYIYDVSNWTRFEVINLIDAKSRYYDNLYHSSKFNRNENNKKYLKAIIKTMNLLNRLRNEKYSRDLEYEWTGNWWIRAKAVYRETDVVKEETLKNLSEDMGMDTYSLACRICEYFNNDKKF